MIHPYQPGSLKGRILRALQTGPLTGAEAYYLTGSLSPDAVRVALNELERERLIVFDLTTWRLASRPPEDAA